MEDVFTTKTRIRRADSFGLQVPGTPHQQTVLTGMLDALTDIPVQNRDGKAQDG
jgi:hypothetical protein